MQAATDRAAYLGRWIAEQPRLLGEQWVATLEDRKREEAEFHDADREGHRDEQAHSTPNRRFYQAMAPVTSLIQGWLDERAPGSVCLDYACGNGHAARRMARSGAAAVVGIDISATSVLNAAESAEREGLASICHFLQRDCEDTTLPDGLFDLALCSGMMHHLDLDRAFPELARILRPGGRILCMEALAYNPFIQLYRRRTPELRTEFEAQHILSLKDVERSRKWFDVADIRYHLMAAPLATFLPEGAPRRAGIALGHAIDAVATRIPLLQRWAWIFTFELVRRG